MTTLEVQVKPKLALVGVGVSTQSVSNFTPDADEDQPLMPLMSRATLAQMYRNMLDSGLTLDDLADF